YITEDQWLSALASGNFGRPVKTYGAILAKHRRHEQLGTEDLEITGEEMPLGIPFSDQESGDFTMQSSQENHGQSFIDTLIIEEFETLDEPYNYDEIESSESIEPSTKATEVDEPSVTED